MKINNAKTFLRAGGSAVLIVTTLCESFGCLSC
jgi:hypothetical protein